MLTIFQKKHHISNSLIDALRTLDLKYFNHKQQSFTFVIFQVDHPVCHFRIHNAIFLFVFQISCIHKTNSWWRNVTIEFDVSIPPFGWALGSTNCIWGVMDSDVWQRFLTKFCRMQKREREWYGERAKSIVTHQSLPCCLFWLLLPKKSKSNQLIVYNFDENISCNIL